MPAVCFFQALKGSFQHSWIFGVGCRFEILGGEFGIFTQMPNDRLVV